MPDKHGKDMAIWFDGWLGAAMVWSMCMIGHPEIAAVSAIVSIALFFAISYGVNSHD